MPTSGKTITLDQDSSPKSPDEDVAKVSAGATFILDVALSTAIAANGIREREAEVPSVATEHILSRLRPATPKWEHTRSILVDVQET
jgi:hypothetical protein